MRRIRVGIVVLAVLATACAGGDDTADEATTTLGPTTEPSAASDETSPADGPSTDTTPSTADSDPSSGLADSLGLASIEVLTPSSQGGDRPDLTWTPVEGADTYQITLLAPDGAFYWGWAGTETSVPVGGFPRLVPEAAGPRLVPEMTWTVIAFDERVIPLAIGGPVPLSP